MLTSRGGGWGGAFVFEHAIDLDSTTLLDVTVTQYPVVKYMIVWFSRLRQIMPLVLPIMLSSIALIFI